MGYRATRVLQVKGKQLQPGDPFPDDRVTPSLLKLGWVEGAADKPRAAKKKVPRKKSASSKKAAAAKKGAPSEEAPAAGASGS